MSVPAGSVLLYSERDALAAELLTPGRALADSLGCALVLARAAPCGEAERTALFERGVDHLLLVPGDALLRGEPARTAVALGQLVQRLAPAIVLLGGSREGNEAAAHLAQSRKLACATRCTSLRVDDGVLVVERGCLGRFVARQALETRPAVATVAAGRFEPPPQSPGRRGNELHEEVELPAPRVERLSSRERPVSRVQLEKARVVVSAGRGLRRREDLELVARLALALRGELGGSRPLTDHLQWLPADVKVGLSGHTVKPELYVAVGISGQLEHLVGMREARLVVAINSDPGAPIFREADFALVGDLYALVPALLRALAALSPPPA